MTAALTFLTVGWLLGALSTALLIRARGVGGGRLTAHDLIVLRWYLLDGVGLVQLRDIVGHLVIYMNEDGDIVMLPIINFLRHAEPAHPPGVHDLSEGMKRAAGRRKA